MRGLELGLDAYYKTARDLLDDGQFGAALILNGFNYDKAYNEGVEASAKYRDGHFQAYGNVSWGIQKATDVVSNQYLFDDTMPLADLGGLTDSNTSLPITSSRITPRSGAGRRASPISGGERSSAPT